MKLVLAALLVLGLAEVREDAGVVPPDTAALSPAVVVRRRAAHINHAVQRRGAAEHLAARLIRRATVEAGDRLALEPPVVGVVRIELVEADRDVNPGMAVALAGLEQQHAIATILGKPSGDGAPRRARPSHNEIEEFPAPLHSLNLPAWYHRRQRRFASRRWLRPCARWWRTSPSLGEWRTTTT